MNRGLAFPIIAFLLSCIAFGVALCTYLEVTHP